MNYPMSMMTYNIRAATTHVIDAEWPYQPMQKKPSVQDKPCVRDIEIHGGQVEFKNLSFAYNLAIPILQDVSFAARPGERVALVGETGGGKSITPKLLCRFCDVTAAGSISIDGQDIRDVTLTSLRDTLGAVPQDPSAFDQTLMQNLLYARPSASEAKPVEACKAARIYHQIMKFPQGPGIPNQAGRPRGASQRRRDAAPGH
ncbi:hypothetical protein E4U57_001375 [Claviceps arundinis]|uniref:ABC transporter domain-containing protein n=1 Tax=Claviceps arundinis TaxID=1623583 RepID=A0ABQ7PL18_9HYPO|nr:hypothetical protein E4U57_001375 [Claviceps arundinis]